MPLLSQFKSFAVSPFGDNSICDELNRFLKAHRIINIEKKLINNDQGTFWIFLVEYSEHQNDTGKQKQRVDYRELLSEQDFAVFDTLRQVRKKLAEKHAVPVYAIFSNEHLAEMVKSIPSTLKAIEKIPGIPTSRVQQYGQEFLQELNVLFSHTREAPK